MADVDVSVVQAVGMTENIGKYIGIDTSVYQGITVAESVSTPVRTKEIFRGANTITAGLLIEDWSLVAQGNVPKFSSMGVPLKGIILMPGTGAPDTFSIKDGADNGAYLFYGVVSAPAMLTFNNLVCKPLVDYSECTLSTGHKITFAW